MRTAVYYVLCNYTARVGSRQAHTKRLHYIKLGVMCYLLCVVICFRGILDIQQLGGHNCHLKRKEGLDILKH